MLRTACLVAVLMSLCKSAAAQPRSTPMKQPMKVQICGRGGEVEIKVHPSFITRLEAPVPIGKTYASDTERFVIWVHDANLRVRPLAQAKPGDRAIIELQIGEQWVSVRLRVVADPDEAELRWEFVSAPGLCANPGTKIWQAILIRYLELTMYRMLSRVSDYVLRPRRGQGNAVAIAPQARLVVQAIKQSQTGDSMEKWELIPTKVTSLGGALRVTFVRGKWRGVDLQFQAMIGNPTPQPYLIKDLLVMVGTQAEERDIETRWPLPIGSTEIAVLPAGGEVLLNVTVRNAARDGRNVLPLTLRVVGAAGDESGTQVNKWKVWDKKYTPEVIDKIYDSQWEQQRRDAEAEGRISLLGVGLLGVLWLENPRDPADTGVASLTGVGGRVRYGINRYLSFESDVIVGWSGAARFGEGTPQELRRDAVLGRVQLGALLTLGEEIIPLARIGVGLQGISHHAEMVATEEELDTELELQGVWYFGGGLGWALTKSIQLGVDVNVLGEAFKVGDGTGAIMVQVGGYAGFSWQP